MIEVDCHDGDIEPAVYHRKTLTSKVPVRDIFRAIQKYAFVSSPYPVIISAEVHCSIEQQNLLAKILREVFGDALVSAPLEKSVEIPSPEQLRHRILFKVSSRFRLSLKFRPNYQLRGSHRASNHLFLKPRLPPNRTQDSRALLGDSASQRLMRSHPWRRACRICWSTPPESSIKGSRNSSITNRGISFRCLIAQAQR